MFEKRVALEKSECHPTGVYRDLFVGMLWPRSCRLMPTVEDEDELEAVETRGG